MKKLKFELIGKLIDGTPVTIDGEFAVGSAISIVDAEGTKSPLADGEYQLEDGTKIMVKDGLIDSISTEEETPVEDVTETPADETPAEDFSSEIKSIKTVIAELQAEVEKFKSLEARLDEKLKSASSFSATEKVEEVKPTKVTPSLKKLFSAMK